MTEIFKIQTKVRKVYDVLWDISLNLYINRVMDIVQSLFPKVKNKLLEGL